MCYTAFADGVGFKELKENAQDFPDEAHKAVLMAVTGAVCGWLVIFIITALVIAFIIAVSVFVAESGNII